MDMFTAFNITRYVELSVEDAIPIVEKTLVNLKAALDQAYQADGKLKDLIVQTGQMEND